MIMIVIIMIMRMMIHNIFEFIINELKKYSVWADIMEDNVFVCKHGLT